MASSILQKVGDDLADLLYYVVMFLLTVGFSIGRIIGEKGTVFQAFAHVFVGLLIGVALARKSWPVGYLAIGISIVEVVVAVISRLH